MNMHKKCLLILAFFVILFIPQSYSYSEILFGRNITITLWNLNENKKLPITGATCNISIYKDDVLIVSAIMTDMNDGRYRYEIDELTNASNTPYEAFINCTKDSYQASTWNEFLIVNKTTHNYILDFKVNLTDILNWDMKYFSVWNATFYYWNGTRFVNFENNFTKIESNFNIIQSNFSRIWDEFNCDIAYNSTICEYLETINSTSQNIYSYITNDLTNKIESVENMLNCSVSSNVCTKLDSIISYVDTLESGQVTLNDTIIYIKNEILDIEDMLDCDDDIEICDKLDEILDDLNMTDTTVYEEFKSIKELIFGIPSETAGKITNIFPNVMVNRTIITVAIVIILSFMVFFVLKKNGDEE